MTYRITLAPAAARQMRKFDPPARRRIQAALELLADVPRAPAAIQLVGGIGEWRVRTGDYRIVYEIQDEQLMVLVLWVGHRRGIYRATWSQLAGHDQRADDESACLSRASDLVGNRGDVVELACRMARAGAPRRPRRVR